MRSYFSSPRRRRRMAIGGAIAAVPISFVLAAQVMPGAKEVAPDRFERGQATPVAAEKPVRLTRRDRTEINATLDRFVPLAVKRRNPGAAYALATPNLRSQATPSQWNRGDIPIHPYPARGTRFRGWTVNFSVRNHVNVDLLLMPARNRPSLGPISFTVDLLKSEDRWLVDAFYPIAVYAPLPPQGNRGPVVSTYDLVPAASGSAPSGGDSRLSHAWFLLPVAIIGGAFALLIGYFAVGSIRARRAWRRTSADRRSLPPLPSTRPE
jgi:hypothetical protein